MKLDIPHARIPNQVHTTPPFTADATLVDDPTALVDDPVALVGGPTTIVEEIKTDVEVAAPVATIKPYR